MSHLVSLLAVVTERVFDDGGGGNWVWGDDWDGLLELLDWLNCLLLDNLLLATWPFSIRGASSELFDGGLSLGELLQIPEVESHDANQENGAITVGVVTLMTMISMFAMSTMSTMMSFTFSMSSLNLLHWDFFRLLFLSSIILRILRKRKCNITWMCAITLHAFCLINCITVSIWIWSSTTWAITFVTSRWVTICVFITFHRILFEFNW